MDNDYLYTDLTAEIIKKFYIVYNKLGYGFLEKVYEKALKFELQKAGLLVERNDHRAGTAPIACLCRQPAGGQRLGYLRPACLSL